MCLFAHPPHPSENFLQKPSHLQDDSQNDSQDDSQDDSLTLNTPPQSPAQQPRNPHDLPTFNSKTLTEPEAPILYLPPLLSSLPERFPSLTVQPQNRPLVTETRLPDIDPVSLSLHKALHHFKPITADYADTPYADAFNWSELVLPEDEEREWYCVVFRSKRKAGSDGGC